MEKQTPPTESTSHKGYNPHAFEETWQEAWEKKGVFRAPTSPLDWVKKPKFYALDMFPYPSGAGLHVGHPEGYTATDVVCRMKRMQGFNVLHPMGWDAFGLPAERAAMRDGIHPAIITKRNIDNFRRQIKRLGFSYDWSREINTSSPDYYRWTQWIFLKLYEKNLAYLAEVPVNWCPALGTVLANEEVRDGKYVETGDPVERRLMKQWMLRITVYAERLLEDLDELDWPDGIKEMQRDWIGKSLGAEIEFSIAGTPHSFRVFTTRADTLMGVTYTVLAPEHLLTLQIATPENRAQVEAYVKACAQRTDLQRTDLAKEKTGVFTGAFASHPITGNPVPIWIADYVLMSYGTGAVMAVPGHDERDHEFAKRYGLPIKEVIAGSTTPVTEKAFTEPGTVIHSDFLDGMSSEAAKKAVCDRLEKNGTATSKVTYRLRDWLFSRQRYWGEPFPIVHYEDGSIGTVEEGSLPIVLPDVDAYRPTDDGEPPLARAPKHWMEVPMPDGRVATRETNTMPQWAGSCWYYLRYLDAHNAHAPFSSEAENYWMPVDLYIGGVEHAVLHLLYARFWHKVLFDCGLVHTKEPFRKLFNQGMILAHSYRDAAGKYYHPGEVEQRDGKPFNKSSGAPLISQVEKMSKSKNNVVNPDDVIRDYGADALRLYELFMGPLEQVKPWQMDGVEGVYRFLSRVWRLIIDDKTGTPHGRITSDAPEAAPRLNVVLHKTIRKVTEDSEKLCFNTAISQMMIFINEATGSEKIPQSVVNDFLRILSPYAPHLAEELWHRLGHQGFVCTEHWPKFDLALTEDTKVTVVVQINGKIREKLEVARDMSSEALEQTARQGEKMVKALEGVTVRKVIVVPNRLINFVV